jgi:hypothetical protein
MGTFNCLLVLFEMFRINELEGKLGTQKSN